MSSQSKARSSAKPTLLSPSQLYSRQDQLLVVDVRGWLEYFMGHVPGAKRLSRDRILQDIPKTQAIAVTCLSGHRSALTAEWLVSQGYQKIHNLQGGLLAWQSAGYPMHRGNRP